MSRPQVTLLSRSHRMTRRPPTTGRQATSTTPEPNHARALWITAAGLDARTLLDMLAAAA